MVKGACNNVTFYAYCPSSGTSVMCMSDRPMLILTLNWHKHCKAILRPTPVALRSKAWVWVHSLAGTAGSNTDRGNDVSLSCALSGRGLYVELITRPEESYRVWCVWVWSWSLDSEKICPTRGWCAVEKKKAVSITVCTTSKTVRTQHVIFTWWASILLWQSDTR